MTRRKLLFILMMVPAFPLYTRSAFPNKSSTSIEAPQTVPKGSEITIRVKTTHNANSSYHHTEWLKVTINQKEIARWDYKGGNLPEAEVFTKEIKVKALENTEVVAEASCNRHGSQGPTTVKILIKD
jgi:desulfoferrodoxin (superoxide reductase-like protein)